MQRLKKTFHKREGRSSDVKRESAVNIAKYLSNGTLYSVDDAVKILGFKTILKELSSSKHEEVLRENMLKFVLRDGCPWNARRGRFWNKFNKVHLVTVDLLLKYKFYSNIC